ncbi:MAG: ABC transporter permease [Candidatus Curtissbacteria bacterium]|nr:ABC transporter permease [Candidatus Curtissbacteria bacterium]
MRRFSSFSGLFAIFFLLVIWQIFATSGIINPFFTSYPTKILSSLINLFSSGFIYKHLTTSAYEFFLGLLIGVSLGIILGIAIGWYKTINNLANTFVTIFYVTPVIALIPLLIVWFGVGVTTKIVVVALATFFPMVINVRTGIRNVNPEHVRVAKSFGAGDFQIFCTVALPHSLPYILSGLRLSLGRALAGVIVAELYGARSGLGYLMTLFSSTFAIDKLMAVILIFIATGITLTQIIHFAEQRLKYRL